MTLKKYTNYLINTIDRELIFRDMNFSDLARETGMTISSLRYRLSRPERLTLEQLYQIAKAFDISLIELLNY